MTQSARTRDGALPRALGASQARAAKPPSVIKDYIELTKPGINRMCLLMAAGGMALAPTTLSPLDVLWALLGTGLAVAGANVLNMWFERDTDPLMKRTRNRPLAARRISDNGAVRFGLLLSVGSIVVLALLTNPITTAIGAFALLSYVLIYTPMKFRSPMALAVGAIPGAVPPLMGWTAATGSLDAAGLVLFAVLFAWQMPHFIAITIFRKHDYARAGIKTVAVVRGDRNAIIQAIAWSVALLATSLLLSVIGVTGWLYASVALAAGLGFLAWSITGLRALPNPAAWAYRFFLLSLMYLPALLAGLILDVALL